MPNITDYVRWYKDAGFDTKPFNDVDNIVLSQLSYIDFKAVLGDYYVGGEDSMTFTECIAKFGQSGIPIEKQAPERIIGIAERRIKKRTAAVTIVDFLEF